MVSAFWRGDSLDKLTGVTFAAATFASVVADKFVAGTFVRPEVGVATLDAVLLGYLLFVMKTSSKFWPIWAVGFHAISVATHLVVLIAPQFLRTPYAIYSEWWSLPVVVALMAGCFEQGTPARARVTRS